MSQPVSLVCLIDLSTLKTDQLLLLEREMKIEFEKRGLSTTQNYSEKKNTTYNEKRKVPNEHYVNKWNAWKRANANRTLNWNWTKKKKGWQMVFSIQDEHGASEIFSRWGKTKKTTQFSLAKIAWYHFVENELIPNEEDFYEIYDDIDSSDDTNNIDSSDDTNSINESVKLN